MTVPATPVGVRCTWIRSRRATTYIGSWEFWSQRPPLPGNTAFVVRGELGREGVPGQRHDGRLGGRRTRGGEGDGTGRLAAFGIQDDADWVRVVDGGGDQSETQRGGTERMTVDVSLDRPLSQRRKCPPGPRRRRLDRHQILVDGVHPSAVGLVDVDLGDHPPVRSGVPQQTTQGGADPGVAACEVHCAHALVHAGPPAQQRVDVAAPGSAHRRDESAQAVRRQMPPPAAKHLDRAGRPPLMSGVHRDPRTVPALQEFGDDSGAPHRSNPSRPRSTEPLSPARETSFRSSPSEHLLAGRI